MTATADLDVSDEAYRRFMQRVSACFAPSQAQYWTRLERAVFSGLIEGLIDRHGYDGVTESMLKAARTDMEHIFEHCNRSLFQ